VNDLDLDSQLEGRLRHTFETVAAATPIDDTPWSRVRREAEGRPSPARWLVAAAAALLLVVGAVGVWWVATRPSSAPVADEPQPRVPLTTAPPPIDPPAPVAPEGEEYPIERISLPGGLDARALGQLQMVDASSFRFWSTSDATLFAFRSVGLQSDTVMEWLCDGQLNSDGGTSMGCGSALELSVRQNWGSSWEQPDGQPGHGIWQWSNVPADTDFVQYRVGDLVMWQRPVDGMASFPAASESNRGVVAIAYRADGAVLARVDVPDLIATIQRESFDWFLEQGLAETFRDISPDQGLHRDPAARARVRSRRRGPAPHRRSSRWRSARRRT
jgi:hypothetical protein